MFLSFFLFFVYFQCIFAILLFVLISLFPFILSLYLFASGFAIFVCVSITHFSLSVSFSKHFNCFALMDIGQFVLDQKVAKINACVFVTYKSRNNCIDKVPWQCTIDTHYIFRKIVISDPVPGFKKYMDPDPTKHQDLNFNENLKISGQSDRDPVNLDPNPKNVRLSNNNTLTFHALHFFFR